MSRGNQLLWIVTCDPGSSFSATQKKCVAPVPTCEPGQSVDPSTNTCECDSGYDVGGQMVTGDHYKGCKSGCSVLLQSGWYDKTSNVTWGHSWKNTGSKCQASDVPVLSPTDPKVQDAKRCPVGQCPGTQNGTSVCVPCENPKQTDKTTSTETKSETPSGASSPASTSTKTETAAQAAQAISARPNATSLPRTRTAPRPPRRKPRLSRNRTTAQTTRRPMFARALKAHGAGSVRAALPAMAMPSSALRPRPRTRCDASSPKPTPTPSANSIR